MPTQFNFQSVIDAFGFRESLDVTDVECALVNGVWVEGEPSRRVISGIVLTTTDKEQRLYQEGNVEEAGISIITNDELYISLDESDTGLQKQSYVNVHNTTFKVMSSGMFLANSGHRQYKAVRYVK